jgi:hypothetical protein
MAIDANVAYVECREDGSGTLHPAPVPCKGARGIWAVMPSDAAIVEAELAQVQMVRLGVARPAPPVPASAPPEKK